MTELENHLLNALKRVETQYQCRDQAFAATLKSLAEQLETLSTRVNDLAARIEHLREIMKQP